MAIFANTNVFGFSDYRVYYTAAFDIASGQKLPAFTSTGGTLMIAHTGAWVIKNMGSIEFWFYINILISCFTILIMWVITKKITGHNGIANLNILFLAFYTPYVLQTSIFYTQIVMIFLASCIIILLIYAFESTNIFLTILYTVAASVLLILSMFFKWELLYFYILIGISSIYLYILKYRKAAFVSLLFCLLSLTLFQLTLKLYEPLQEYLIKGANDLMFFGHTPYGGGEGVMLDNYREPYKKGLEEFTKQHGSEYEDYVSLRNAYNIKLIKDFIFNHPIQWAGLQAKKFFRTLGVKPEGMGFRILVSGKIGPPKIISGLLLSVPFIILFLCCVFLFDWDIVKKLFSSSIGIFMVTVFFYYIIATIFYPHYQIRYRLPLEVFFLCPAAAAFVVTAFTKNSSLIAAVKKHFKWKLIVFIIFVFAWVYEVYDIFYLNRDRYIINAEKYEQGIIP